MAGSTKAKNMWNQQYYYWEGINRNESISMQTDMLENVLGSHSPQTGNYLKIYQH